MQLPDKVGLSEPLARYLMQKDHYSLTTNSVKEKAFLPPPDLHLSVYRIEGLTIEEVRRNGQENVVSKMPQSRTLHGAARIKASAIEEVNLRVDPDNSPPRHACVVGWPEGEESEQKSKRKLLAQELAAKSELIVFPQTL